MNAHSWYSQIGEDRRMPVAIEICSRRNSGSQDAGHEQLAALVQDDRADSRRGCGILQYGALMKLHTGG